MFDDPIVIDGFAGPGGAGRGWHDAGFQVVGVELNPSPNYPYPQHRGDAVTAIPRIVANYHKQGRNVVHVHVSPPCQKYIAITAGNEAREGWTDTHDEHPDLIPPTRAMLADLRREYGVTTSMENGVSKSIRRDLRLCGLMFRLPTFRHRYFEIDGFTVAEPPHAGLHDGHRAIGWRHGHLATREPSDCPKCGEWHCGTVYGVYGDGGGKPSVAESQLALGLHHTDVQAELNEAIPPAYTRHIGLQLRAHLDTRAAA